MSNVDILKSHYAASARKDIDAMVAPFDPHVEWTEMAGFPYAGTYHGPEGVKENVFFRIGAEWDGYDALPDAFIDGGDTVAVTGLYQGTYKATGKFMQARFVLVWTFQDGRAVKFEQFTDTLKVREAMY